MALNEKLIVGRLPFLVCAPFFHTTLNGLNCNDQIEFLDGVPRFLNHELQAGRIDCAPSSSFEYGLHFEDYFLIPGLSTSSRMEIKSVLFLSTVPWEQISGMDVQLSSDSATSNVLFQILSQKYFSVSPKIISGSEENENAVGKVFIGDKALSQSLNPLWTYRYDLAEVWQKWQNLPFSFGLWMVRRESVVQKKKALRFFLQILSDALKSFKSNPSLALDHWTQFYPSQLSREFMLQFYATADYGFSEAHEKSLNLFYRLALEAGFLKTIPKLEYLSL